MAAADIAYSARLNAILDDLEDSRNQGDALSSGDFVRLAVATFALPVVALLITWWVW